MEDDGEIMNKTDGRRGERQRENPIIFSLKMPNDLIIHVGHGAKQDSPRLPPRLRSRQLITFKLRHRFLSFNFL